MIIIKIFAYFVYQKYISQIVENEKIDEVTCEQYLQSL